MRSYAAVDLGASAGRVMVGRVGPGSVELVEAHRFANEPVRLADGLHWDVLGLYRETLVGLRKAASVGPGPLASIGIDSWAVDYGLLGGDGSLLGNPYHYRDPRTRSLAPPVPADELYAVTGIQHMPINTLYQLLAERTGPRLAAARTLLMIPDLLGYWLTGQIGAERTNASTTQLFDVRTGTWSDALIAGCGLPRDIFPPLREPGETIGLAEGVPVVAVASHDTASAVAAVPATGPDFAYISCGTWSLVGVELRRPVLSDPSFTNEVGVDGTIRYLRNVMGLWLLQECQRAWGTSDTAGLLAQAQAAPAFAALVDPDDPAFLAPGDMPGRIAAACHASGQREPGTAGEMTRCVLESLAIAHRRSVRAAARLAGRDVRVVHLVGGGARNALLCQLTADACGLPVLAGPVEATALGNVLVQARAEGGPPDLPAMRALVRASYPPRCFSPTPGVQRAWDEAAARVGRA